MFAQTRDDKGRIVFKTDVGLLNYSQRNNEYKYIHPKSKLELVNSVSMCNVTAYCEAAEINRFRFPSGKYKQPEDNFCDFLLKNKEVLAYYKNKLPAMYASFEKGEKGCFPPNEVHTVLCYGFNRWMGVKADKPAVTFYDNALLQDIISEVTEKGHAVVMSGTFPYVYANGGRGTIGHINVLVGMVFTKYEGLNSIPDLLIFDDTYGSMYQNFKAGTGNDVYVPFSDFVKYYKPLNDRKIKYAHIFSNAAAVI